MLLRIAPRFRQLWPALFTGVLWTALACSSATPTSLAASSTSGLPPYDENAATLFDDSIAPEVFGLGAQRPSARSERLLQQRSVQADHVARVKLRTIREERFDEALRYRLVFEPLGDPIAGPKLPPDVEVSVGRASPSLSTLRSMSVEAVGTKFILLLKQYQLNSEPVLHFRGEPDRADVTAAILQARKGLDH
jgi:hypothetical protein